MPLKQNCATNEENNLHHKMNFSTLNESSLHVPSKEEVYILSFSRSSFGKVNRRFANSTLDDFLLPAIKDCLKKAAVDPTQIQDSIFGNVNSPAASTEIRMVLLKSGIPVSTPVSIVNRQCASGLDAIAEGSRRIKLGECDFVLVGGFEQMSKNPMPFNFNVRDDRESTDENSNMNKLDNCALENHASSKGDSSCCSYSEHCRIPMGTTAEEVAFKFGITREAADNYAVLSHSRAFEAEKSGFFVNEKFDTLPDEGIREGTNLTSLAKLKPVFTSHKNERIGICTAGNSSQLSDGACALVLCSARVLNGRKYLGRFVDFVSVGVDPLFMGLGPFYAISKLRERFECEGELIYEINEAFSCQVLACIKMLGLGLDCVNLNGGAVALGHPLGASGARLVGSLLSVMERKNVKKGVVSLCVGGGMGVAALIERD